MNKMKPILNLFSPETLREMKQYAPPEHLHDREKTISGRLLEETVELHLVSGGTPQSVMSHIMDAIVNESFKAKKNARSPREAYPSNFESRYDDLGVTEELGDTLFVWIVNMLTNNESLDEVEKVIRSKMDKLKKAREDGKLTITEKGLFYIQKD